MHERHAYRSANQPAWILVHRQSGWSPAVVIAKACLGFMLSVVVVLAAFWFAVHEWREGSTIGRAGALILLVPAGVVLTAVRRLVRERLFDDRRVSQGRLELRTRDAPPRCVVRVGSREHTLPEAFSWQLGEGTPARLVTSSNDAVIEVWALLADDP